MEGIYPLMSFNQLLAEGVTYWTIYVAVALMVLIFLIKKLRRAPAESSIIEIAPPSDSKANSLNINQLFNLLHRQLSHDSIFRRNTDVSLEIVSSKEGGIRYLIHLPKALAAPTSRHIRACLPGVRIRTVPEYLPKNLYRMKVLELRLAENRALPINSDWIDKRWSDSIEYLANSLAQAKAREVFGIQICIRPLSRREQGRLRKKINRLDLIELTDRAQSAQYAKTRDLIVNKVSQPLFKSSIRLMLMGDSKQLKERERGLIDVLTQSRSSGQYLKVVKRFRSLSRKRWGDRVNEGKDLLCSAEIAELYHFPQQKVIEDLSRLKSPELPAVLSLKNKKGSEEVFALNNYGGLTTDISLSEEERSRHIYLLGQTGAGKSTVIYHLAKGDIKRGRGVAVIDPHGDLSEDLLATIPEDRMSQMIYLNPIDISHPVGINLLEIKPGLSEDELELEKELVCESTISILRKMFYKTDSVDAHRIEYILRNTIHTALTIPDATIFTVYDLLTNAAFRKSTVSSLDNDDLKNFWNNEFNKAGSYQIVKMTAGVNAKIGRLLFSPISRRILEQKKSTIDFNQIINNKQILICNLSEGKIGEDTSQLLGTIIVSKIQQAVTRQVRKSGHRPNFYLFIDEFQNFATPSFTRLLSGSRKFGLRLTLAEQSTAQQDNPLTTEVVLANTGIVICFRTASPYDEEKILPQFFPLVSKGEIANLPRHSFYIKIASAEAEDAFSGTTLPVDVEPTENRINRVADISRNNWAITYEN